MRIPSSRRCVDIAASTAGLILLGAPIAAMIALARFESGKTGLFRQRRYGLKGAPFEILKIRSLDGQMKPLPVIGKLRNLGLDELPQIINIARGEMSVFGPRPIDRLFDRPGWERRLAIPPGLIEPGTIQAKERGVSTTSENCAAITEAYVDRRLANKWCIGTDLDVAVRTARIVLRGKVDRGNSHARSAAQNQNSLEPG